MSFMQAIQTCFQKYFGFWGRASRSEYWWWVLFVFSINMTLNILTFVIGDIAALVNGLFTLAVLLPGLAVTFRRLHDIGKTAWWILILFIPIIGFIVFIYFTVKKGEDGENKHGPNPLGGSHSLDKPEGEMSPSEKFQADRRGL